MVEEAINPWEPITDRGALKRLGKLGEELGELTAATSRTIIQGLDEVDPKSGKPNRQWLTEEIADVIAMCEFAADYFGLDKEMIETRIIDKRARQEFWQGM